MADVPVLVLRAAGINCDEEVMHCWRVAGARPKLMHINRVAESPTILDDFTVVTIPGGFSYGDDIAAGTILAQRVLLDIMEPLRKLVDRGGGLLGICNGFQVLVKMGLLPGGDAGRDQVTVTYNDSAKFEARWVKLQVATDRCVFLTPDAAPRAAGTPSPSRAAGFSPRESSETGTAAETDHAQHAHASVDMPPDVSMAPCYLELPVEHAEGKVVTSDDAATERLEKAGQIAVRYVDSNGRCDTYPANPNGSVAGIAGLCDPTGRIFGLMPHPDRHFEHTHHPLWTRRNPEGSPDGLTVFQNAVRYWSR